MSDAKNMTQKEWSDLTQQQKYEYVTSHSLDCTRGTSRVDGSAKVGEASVFRPHIIKAGGVVLAQGRRLGDAIEQARSAIESLKPQEES
jgi:hypothetical protein